MQQSDPSKVRRCPIWCGECYSNCRGRTNIKGHRAYRPVPLPFGAMSTMPISKPSGSSAAAGSVAPPVPSEWWSAFPTVWEWLTVTRFDDGSPRQSSTITICYDQGTLKACLNDRAGRRSLWGSGTQLGDILASLEAHLASNDPSGWRSYQDYQPKKK